MPAIAEAEKIAEDPEYWLPQQFKNPANPAIHEKTTGPEIWKQTNGEVTHLFASVGTGGTVTGAGRFLKEQNPDIQIIADRKA